jgi:DnaJ-class molecular chaperone
MWVALEDHYALLGVPRGVTRAELRRAYRLLALQLHPDRAGFGSTAMFQRVAEAYRVLSDPVTRAQYDRQLRDSEGPATRPPPVTNGRRHRPIRRDDLVARLSGPLDVLVGRSAARRRSDGVIELFLMPAEAAAGGTAALELPVEITCPTCAGVAAVHVVWCARCEYKGRVTEVVAIAVEIPPAVQDRTAFVFATDPGGNLPPLRVLVRLGTAW